jgi:hypothetical protein
MATQGRKGEFSKTITVQSNDASNRSPTLTCKGRALVAIKTEPMLVNFGTIERGSEPKTQTVKVTRGDGGPLALEVVPPKETQVATQVREIEAGESYELAVTLTPPFPGNDFRSDLTLNTGIAEAPTETIKIMARFPARLSAEPPRFTIPVNLTQATDFRSKLKWSGPQPGKILEAASADATLNVRVEEDEDGTPVVVMTVPADYQFKGNALITVKTDDAEAPTIGIPVMRPPARPAQGPTTRPRPAPAGLRPGAPTAAPTPGGDKLAPVTSRPAP